MQRWSPLRQTQWCKSSQFQRAHGEYFPSDVPSAVVISLSMGTAAFLSPNSPPEIFFPLVCRLPPTKIHPCVEAVGIPSHHPPSLFAFVLLPSMGRSSYSLEQIFSCPWCCGQHCSNSSLRSDVHSHPQSSLVSWVLTNYLVIVDLVCLEHLIHAQTFCGWENRLNLFII